MKLQYTNARVSVVHLVFPLCTAWKNVFIYWYTDQYLQWTHSRYIESVVLSGGRSTLCYGQYRANIGLPNLNFRPISLFFLFHYRQSLHVVARSYIVFRISCVIQ